MHGIDEGDYFASPPSTKTNARRSSSNEEGKPYSAPDINYSQAAEGDLQAENTELRRQLTACRHELRGEKKLNEKMKADVRAYAIISDMIECIALYASVTNYFTHSYRSLHSLEHAKN